MWVNAYAWNDQLELVLTKDRENDLVKKLWRYLFRIVNEGTISNAMLQKCMSDYVVIHLNVIVCKP